MFKIVCKEELTPIIKKIVVETVDIARKAKAGQFVILMIDEKGERIPLTIADKDPERGTITLVFQEVGKTTCHLGKLGVGDFLLNLVGPLGKPTEIKLVGNVVCVGGGVGVAEVYPVARAFKEVGNEVTGIIGAREKKLVIFERELRFLCDEFWVTTDDGSYGEKGFVSDILERLIDEERKINLVYAVGPVGMMKQISEITRSKGIKTFVSINPVMVDGTGMCGSCRVRVGDETKFACVDGPEFNGHQVDFNELEARLKLFCDAEKKSMDIFEKFK